MSRANIRYVNGWCELDTHRGSIILDRCVEIGGVKVCEWCVTDALRDLNPSILDAADAHQRKMALEHTPSHRAEVRYVRDWCTLRLVCYGADPVKCLDFGSGLRGCLDCIRTALKRLSPDPFQQWWLKDHDDKEHEQIEEFDLDGEKIEVCLDCLIKLIEKNMRDVFAWKLGDYHEIWHQNEEAVPLVIDDKIYGGEVLICPGCVAKVFYKAKKLWEIEECEEDEDDEA